MCTSKSRKIQEMDSEYRFDYEKAKPNRFAEKMNLNVGWTVEKFVEEQKEGKKTSSSKGKPAAKAKPAKKSPTNAKKKIVDLYTLEYQKLESIYIHLTIIRL